MTPRPIGKVASGGELSRFLLALKVSLARGNEALVLIFDEIDRGVGGATADAVVYPGDMATDIHQFALDGSGFSTSISAERPGAD